MATNTTTISVRLPHATRRALDDVARKTRRSRAYIIKEALDRQLPQMTAERQSDIVANRLRILQEVKGAGGRAGGLRSVEEIDALIREIRGDD